MDAHTPPVGEVDLAEIRKRYDATTPGTWHVVRSAFGDPYPSSQFGFVIEAGDTAISYAAFGQRDTRTSGIIRPEDAAFIAEAHQDVPALLGAVEQRDARIQQLGSFLDGLLGSNAGLQQAFDAQQARIAALEGNLAAFVTSGHQCGGCHAQVYHFDSLRAILSRDAAPTLVATNEAPGLNACRAGRRDERRRSTALTEEQRLACERAAYAVEHVGGYEQAIPDAEVLRALASQPATTAETEGDNG